jgi:8-oxo-dGTP pyrophosphatase MutT (NUDIX family)
VRIQIGETGPDAVRVLLINASRGEGLVFPKGGWETDETVEAAARRETVEEAGVRGNLEVCPYLCSSSHLSRCTQLTSLPCIHEVTSKIPANGARYAYDHK